MRRRGKSHVRSDRVSDVQQRCVISAEVRPFSTSAATLPPPFLREERDRNERIVTHLAARIHLATDLSIPRGKVSPRRRLYGTNMTRTVSTYSTRAPPIPPSVYSPASASPTPLLPRGGDVPTAAAQPFDAVVARPVRVPSVPRLTSRESIH